MDLGFHRAGYETRWVCEVDPFRRQLLAKHFPQAKQCPDLTTLNPAELEPVDVLIGGTPCQDLSHAGQRAGLDGERSGLFWDYMRIRNELNIPWCVWENVEGAFSSNNGLDFACVLGAFVGADVTVPAGGWPRAGVVSGPWGGAVWRMVDAQYFGVSQRRRRVFVVGHLGGECPPEVLFELASGAGYFAEGRKARTGASGSAADGARSARTLTRGLGRLDGESEDFVVSHTLTSKGFDASEDGTGRGTPLVEVAERAWER